MGRQAGDRHQPRPLNAARVLRLCGEFGIMAANTDIAGYVEECWPLLQTSDEIWGILDTLERLRPEMGVGQSEESGAKCDTMLFWHGCGDVKHKFGALFKGDKLLSVAGPDNF